MTPSRSPSCAPARTASPPLADRWRSSRQIAGIRAQAVAALRQSRNGSDATIDTTSLAALIDICDQAIHTERAQEPPEARSTYDPAAQPDLRRATTPPSSASRGHTPKLTIPATPVAKFALASLRGLRSHLAALSNSTATTGSPTLTLSRNVVRQLLRIASTLAAAAIAARRKPSSSDARTPRFALALLPPSPASVTLYRNDLVPLLNLLDLAIARARANPSGVLS